MEAKPPKKITYKIILGYLSLALLGLVAGNFIFSEIKSYISSESAASNDQILLNTNDFLTAVYEAENLSKISLAENTYKSFKSYAAKVDSLILQIDSLKNRAQSPEQKSRFDSLRVLLRKKVRNNAQLRKLRSQNEKSGSIDSLLKSFNEMEVSMGRIIPETLVPNFEQLSPETQQTIKEYVALLNRNVPKNADSENSSEKIDSILAASRSILKKAKDVQTETQQSLERKELEMARTDLQLSRQLQRLVSSFEQEINQNTHNNNLKKQAALKRSRKLALFAALAGLALVVLFTFLIARDFWKAQEYRKKLEREKRYSESLLKSREQLIATVSHDLRTPLGTIVGHSELMQQHNLAESQKRYLKNIRAASSYIENLVSDLLDFSKLEAGKIRIAKKPYILSDLIGQCAEEHKKLHQNKPIELVLQLDEGLEKPIMGDPLRTQQILNNLIGNAFKFTEKGYVKIKARVESEKRSHQVVKIAVSDSGIGIKKEKQEHIFKEFVQSGEDAEKRYGGYGLGLTISKKLTELLDGELSVESEEGKGSVFTLTLPAEFTKETPAQPDTALPNLNTETALLIFDDDRAHLDLLVELCRKINIKAVAFTDFEQIKTHENLAYDAVLTDIQMPSTDGFGVLKELRSEKYPHYTNQPIIAMTGRMDVASEAYLNAGFSAVLRKPFSINALIDILNKELRASLASPPKRQQYKSGKPVRETPIFNLELVESFLGSDGQEVSKLLETFLCETEANMKTLQTAVANHDITEIRKTAHRMLPMFRQLKVQKAIPYLEKMETLSSDLKSDQLKPLLKSLSKEVKKLKKELEAHLATHPSHID